MDPVFKEAYIPKDFNEVPVSPHLANVLHQTEKKEWNNFWNFIRLNLQGRINGQETTDDIKKLQGKIEFIQEISGFFDKLLEKR